MIKITQIVIRGIITKIAQEKKRKHVKGAKENAEFKTQLGGWFITVNNISYFVGDDEPEHLKVGDEIEIVLRKPKIKKQNAPSDQMELFDAECW